MTDLLARLEVVEAGSRELDYALERTFSPHGLGFQDSTYRKMEDRDEYVVPPYTTSLDAALALAERLGLDVLAIMNEAVEGLAVGEWSSSLRTLVPELARHACIAILRATHKAEGAEG